ncbi:MAG: outer membrane beta-barrel protein [Bacteroidia bacterium]|nr:outer membrane beta-barrel protein [Bacteroidia bacterium]
MKKNIIIVLMIFLACLLTDRIYSQGAYVNINAGYGINMSSQNIKYFDLYNYNYGTNSSTYQQVNASLGKGFTCEGTFGYMFNKYIGAELGVSYLSGAKTKATQTYQDETDVYCLSSNMLRINPSIVIACNFDKINPYAKFGLVLGCGSIFYDNNNTDSTGDVSVLKEKLYGGYALGLSSAVGITYKLCNKISLFAEINMVNLSYSPTKGKVTQSTDNGVDNLPNMTTYQKEIEFVDSYTNSSNTPPDVKSPNHVLKQYFPFGSFGATLGLRINF